MRRFFFPLAFLLVLAGCDSSNSAGGTTTSTAPPEPTEPEVTTFRVAVVSSTTYPDGTVVFMINGEQDAELTLTRGVAYTFDMADMPAHHPFHLSTSPAGADGGEGAWDVGVTGNFASGNDTLTFVVPEEAPDLLFYQCANHELMGGRINIVSS